MSQHSLPGHHSLVSVTGHSPFPLALDWWKAGCLLCPPQELCGSARFFRRARVPSPPTLPTKTP